MFINQQTIQAETAWRFERTKRSFRGRRNPQAAEQYPAPRPVRRALRPTAVA